MPSWLPEAASSYAADMDGLIWTITVIVGVWLIAAELLLVYFILRYRRGRARRAAYIPANGLRTMSFVLVPCAVILGFDLVIDAISAPVWDEIKIHQPDPDARVRIQGEQWAWRITYPGPDGRFETADDFERVNELRVPLGQVVVFELGAKDVLHSLWIPELRLKQDAVPGRTIRGWFRATKEGQFEVICAEICGVAHTLMKGTLRVEPPEAYRQWIEASAPEAAAGSSES